MIIFNKARQIGGSFAISFRAVYRAITMGKNQIIISTNIKNAKRVITECKKIIRLFEITMGRKFKLISDSQTELVFDSGPTITCISNNPDTAVGFSGDLTIDEASRFKNGEEIIEATLPFISRGHTISIVSTPLGTSGFFYDFVQKAREPDSNWSLHEIDVYEAIRQGAPLNIDKIKDEMDDDSFARNYLCRFIDTNDQFFTLELLTDCIDYELDNFSNEKLKKIPFLVAGLDVAKRSDSTVLTVIEKMMGGKNRVVLIKEFQKVDYIDQIRWICNLTREIGIKKIYLDRTGVGDAVEELFTRNLGSTIEPIVFNNNNKELMITNLKLLFEKQQIVIPDNRKLFDQLIGLNRSFTNSGMIKFEHEKGKHDDYAWSLALATSSLKADRRPITISGVLPIHRRIKAIG